MKSTPIIICQDLMPATLDGRKTMTRRTKGLKMYNENPDEWEFQRLIEHKGTLIAQFRNTRFNSPLDVKCPFGQVGDELWIRETWRIESFMDGEPLLIGTKDGKWHEEDSSGDEPNYEEWHERICIQSTDDAMAAYKKGLCRYDESDDYYKWDIGQSPCRWRSSMFMPKWACRCKKIIKSMRCERVQDITEEDAIKEGIAPAYKGEFIAQGVEMISMSGIKTIDYPYWDSAKEAFEKLWDKLNTKRGHPWEKNDWVWVPEW